MDRMTHKVAGFYRVNNVPWEVMKQKIIDIATKYYDTEITLDATGNGGDMFAESLDEAGAIIDTKFIYTNSKKIMLIDKLGIKMSAKNITFPNIRQLVKEITSFTYHLTDSGNLKYGSRQKDDCVNALALSCWNLNEEPLGDMTSKDNIFAPKRRKFA